MRGQRRVNIESKQCANNIYDNLVRIDKTNYFSFLLPGITISICGAALRSKRLLTYTIIHTHTYTQTHRDRNSEERKRMKKKEKKEVTCECKWRDNKI